MSLTQAEVEHIAHLARLELTVEEVTRYRQQLSAILDYAARLQSVDTSRIAPTAGATLDAAPLRADDPVEGLDVDIALRNAPQREDNQFRVPPVLE